MECHVKSQQVVVHGDVIGRLQCQIVIDEEFVRDFNLGLMRFSREKSFHWDRESMKCVKFLWNLLDDQIKQDLFDENFELFRKRVLIKDMKSSLKEFMNLFTLFSESVVYGSLKTHKRVIRLLQHLWSVFKGLSDEKSRLEDLKLGDLMTFLVSYPKSDFTELVMSYLIPFFSSSALYSKPFTLKWFQYGGDRPGKVLSIQNEEDKKKERKEEKLNQSRDQFFRNHQHFKDDVTHSFFSSLKDDHLLHKKQQEKNAALVKSFHHYFQCLFQTEDFFWELVLRMYRFLVQKGCLEWKVIPQSQTKDDLMKDQETDDKKDLLESKRDSLPLNAHQDGIIFHHKLKTYQNDFLRILVEMVEEKWELEMVQRDHQKNDWFHEQSFILLKDEWIEQYRSSLVDCLEGILSRLVSEIYYPSKKNDHWIRQIAERLSEEDKDMMVDRFSWSFEGDFWETWWSKVMKKQRLKDDHKNLLRVYWTALETYLRLVTFKNVSKIEERSETKITESQEKKKREWEEMRNRKLFAFLKDSLSVVKGLRYYLSKNLPSISLSQMIAFYTPHVKRNMVQGHHVSSIHVVIYQEESLREGDKLTGRYGNKGVVSRILPSRFMPCLKDGTPLQVALNPLGVTSRMNVGQLLEVGLGLVSYLSPEDFFRKELTEDFSLEKSRLTRLQRNFVSSKKCHWKVWGKENQEMDQKEAGIEYHLPSFTHLDRQKEMKERAVSHQINPTFQADLIDPFTGETLMRKTTIGCMYMVKLEHIVTKKASARAQSGKVHVKSGQPRGGKRHRGGQKYGEMEIACFLAYGANYLMAELLGFKSSHRGDTISYGKSYDHGLPLEKFTTSSAFKGFASELETLGGRFQSKRDLLSFGLDDERGNVL